MKVTCGIPEVLALTELVTVVFKTKANGDAERLTLSRASVSWFLTSSLRILTGRKLQLPFCRKLELLQLVFPSSGLETRSGGINVSS